MDNSVKILDLVSICIPTYEMGGVGTKYFKEALNSIKKQVGVLVEVVVSDHCLDNSIESVCKAEQDLQILYIRNFNKKGSSSANLNNAINSSSGTYIKVLFQDDLLVSKHSIFHQLTSIKEGVSPWNVSACTHTKDGETFFNDFTPVYSENILEHNTISSPSVLMFQKEIQERFDENLLWFMDVDFYKRMYDRYGKPSICYNHTVANRIHDLQVTNTLIHEALIQEERKHITQKYA